MKTALPLLVIFAAYTLIWWHEEQVAETVARTENVTPMAAKEAQRRIDCGDQYLLVMR